MLKRISRSERGSAAPVIASYGLPILGVVLAIFFSILLPGSFPTALTIQSIFANQTSVLLLALGLTVVVATGEFDLSIGYGLGLMYILAIGFIDTNHLPWPISIILVIILGPLLGLINGLLVHVAKIDSFIATLGTGTICYGISEWYTGGQQIVGVLPTAFTKLASNFILGIPQPAVVALIVAAILWVVLEYTPAGRYFYALGFNRKAAVLSGVSSRRYGILAFMISGLCVAIAGILLASRLQVGQSDTGGDLLLPAFVGALLGKTTVRPGRPNIIGTIVAVIVLAIGISGLEQLGGQFFVENLFNGFTLVIAVGVAGFVSRRRISKKAAVVPDASRPHPQELPPNNAATDPVDHTSKPQQPEAPSGK